MPTGTRTSTPTTSRSSISSPTPTRTRKKAGPVEAISALRRSAAGRRVERLRDRLGQLDEAKNSGFQSELTSVDLITADCGDYPQYADAPEYHCARPAGLPAMTPTLHRGQRRPARARHRQSGPGRRRDSGVGCYREDSAGLYLRIDHDHFYDWIQRAMAADPAISELP